MFLLKPTYFLCLPHLAPVLLYSFCDFFWTLFGEISIITCLSNSLIHYLLSTFKIKKIVLWSFFFCFHSSRPDKLYSYDFCHKPISFRIPVMRWNLNMLFSAHGFFWNHIGITYFFGKTVNQTSVKQIQHVLGGKPNPNNSSCFFSLQILQFSGFSHLLWKSKSCVCREQAIQKYSNLHRTANMHELERKGHRLQTMKSSLPYVVFCKNI